MGSNHLLGSVPSTLNPLYTNPQPFEPFEPPFQRWRLSTGRLLPEWDGSELTYYFRSVSAPPTARFCNDYVGLVPTDQHNRSSQVLGDSSPILEHLLGHTLPSFRAWRLACENSLGHLRWQQLHGHSLFERGLEAHAPLI